MADVASLVKPTDTGKSPAGVAKRWMMEIDLAGNAEKNWRRVAEKVVSRYRGEGMADPDKKDNNADTLNILFANVQTLAPVLYNSTPEPVVERRNKDDDPVAKAAAEVLRRAIKYTVSCQDFSQIMSLAVQDYLLPGRAQVTVKYVPTMGKVAADATQGTGSDDSTSQDSDTPDAGDTIQPSGGQATEIAQGQANLEAEAQTEELVYEEIVFDLVPWKGYRRGPGRTWQDVPWDAIELELTREACIDLFGQELGQKIPLRSMQPDDKYDKEAIDKESVFQRANIWQVWDKQAREILYISPDYKDGPLKVANDEYNLTGFFPRPRPLYAVETSDSLVPVAEFTEYQTLADEAETLTNRLAKMARMIRVIVAHDASLSEIEKMTAAQEGDTVPVKNAREWMENGGLEGALWFWPIDKIVAAYQALVVQRDSILQLIWQMMGIADIQRGSSDPDETYGAQRIKEKWGTLRTRRRQSEVQRFCRDLMCIAGELIAEKFSPETLAMMTGMYFPTAEEKQRVQQTMAAYQQQAQMAQAQPPAPGAPPGAAPSAPAPQPQLPQGPPPIPPDVQQQAQQLLALPSWEDIVGLLRNDAMRHFRIDIQTDSTIALQEAEDQGDYVQMMSGVVELFNQLQPAVESGVLPFDAAKAIVVGFARKFRLGYQIEDELSQMKQPAQKDPMQDPEVLKAQAVATIKAGADAKGDQARAIADVIASTIKGHIEAGTQQAVQAAQAKYNILEAAIEALPGVIIQHLKNVGALGVARVNAGVDAGEALLAHEEALGDQSIQRSQAPPAVPSTSMPGNGAAPMGSMLAGGASGPMPTIGGPQ